MTKVIRKESYEDVSGFSISRRDIEAIETDTSVILTEAVKQAVEVVYDELGYANVDVIDLGVQYDHRVTWLHFNLDKLLWYLNKGKGYAEDTKYNHYTFKVAFTRLDARGQALETSVWEFDGVDFEIPRGVTKEEGLYQIVLMIEEYQKDDLVGNIKTETAEFLERFVAKPIKGRVYPTFYHPTFDISDTVTETDQEAALVKPKILCTLTDTGAFAPDTKELGQQHDSFIRYFKFNPRRISAHLNDFYVFAIFKQDDKFHHTMFERTLPDDPFDDYSDSHPIIAWIPRGVYEVDGMWQVAIVAFTGNLEHMNDIEEDNGDYYFYVSKEVKMKVVKNGLSVEDVTKEPILSTNAGLITSLGEIIITANDEIYQPEDIEKGMDGIIEDTSKEILIINGYKYDDIHIFDTASIKVNGAGSNVLIYDKANVEVYSDTNITYRGGVVTAENLTAENIAKDVTILGVTGMLEAGGGGVTPTGTIEITENGTHDVSQYANANVNVSGGTPIELATSEEMEAVLVADNIGKIYKFVGETNEIFTNGNLYQVINEVK